MIKTGVSENGTLYGVYGVRMAMKCGETAERS